MGRLKSKVGRILSGEKKDLPEEGGEKSTSHDLPGDATSRVPTPTSPVSPTSPISRKPLKRGAKVDSDLLDIRPDVPPKNADELLSAQKTLSGHVVGHRDPPTRELRDSGAENALKDAIGGSEADQIYDPDEARADYSSDDSFASARDQHERTTGGFLGRLSFENEQERQEPIQASSARPQREIEKPLPALNIPERNSSMKHKVDDRDRDIGKPLEALNPRVPQTDKNESDAAGERDIRKPLKSLDPGNTGGTNFTNIADKTFESDQEKDVQNAMESLNLRNTEQTEIHETLAPAVTHETIHKQTTELVQEEITRDIHTYDEHTTIQPIVETEVLPTRHYIHDIHGNLVEIAGPVSGLEYHIERRW